MSMFVYVLACSIIQYHDESFNGAMVICRWLFRERVHFYKILGYSWKAFPLFSTTKEKNDLSHPVSEYKKSKTILHSYHFCQPHSSSTRSCCTTDMTRITIHRCQQCDCLFCVSSITLLMLLNCLPLMCPTLNPLDQLLKKWILRIV